MKRLGKFAAVAAGLALFGNASALTLSISYEATVASISLPGFFFTVLPDEFQDANIMLGASVSGTVNVEFDPNTPGSGDLAIYETTSSGTFSIASAVGSLDGSFFDFMAIRNDAPSGDSIILSTFADSSIPTIAPIEWTFRLIDEDGIALSGLDVPNPFPALDAFDPYLMPNFLFASSTGIVFDVPLEDGTYRIRAELTDYSATIVPVPAGAVLLFSGLLGVFGIRKRGRI